MMNILDNFRSYINQNRTVYRAGWLRYIPFNEIVPSEEHRFWVVFSVTNHNAPFLEFYRRRQNIGNFFNEGPVSKHSLDNCRSVIAVNNHEQYRPQNSQQNNETFELNVCMKSQTIRLAADTKESMMDWIYSLQSKLSEFNILQNTEYSDSDNKQPVLPPRNSYVNVQNSEHKNILSPTIRDNQSNNDNNSDAYERIFNKNNRNSINNNDHDDDDDDDDEPPPPYELPTFELPNSSTNTTTSTMDSLSFREQQVESLRQQISTSGGINIKIRRKDLLKGVAFVDVDNQGVFICGWRQRQCPTLHDIFHIGDQILSINDQSFQHSDDVRLFLKEFPLPKVELLVRRLPFGHIFCLKREFPKQDLGIVRKNGTAQILDLKKNSIASNAGLYARSFSVFDYDSNSSDTEGNWHLTEINNRPLNLFFKDNEIETRLNAIGKEISILVQPSAFVRKLKKQMKNNVKNYKEYIVQ